MKHQLLPAMLLILGVSAAYGQHFDMTQWGTDRGYHERTGAPYYRYEAEQNSGSNGQLLEQTDDQQYVQSEASNQQAVVLTSGQYLKWNNDSGDANGVTLRYSLPYNGSATVGFYIDEQEIGRMDINTNHSWEWNATHQGNRYSKPEYYSTHGQQKDWARMRFDEEMCLLSRDIRRGQNFEIRNISGSPVTVDFVEIEKAEYLSEQDARNRYGNDIQYYGPGTYNQDLNGGKSVGAGIFYTKFTGKCNSGWVAHVRFSGTQNQRYPWAGNDEGPNGYNDIKCINGGGYWENVLIEHYTCGAWMGGSTATFKHCRIRNNYADGVNFWNGSSNCVVERCNFRNNGDDDIASWSNDGHSTGHSVSYTTCEHNWRASSLGWFGGGNHYAGNMLIKDGMENGIRCVTDFGGDGFHADQPHKYDNISIVHQGCTYGRPGRDGDFWGVDEAALHIEASNNGNIERQIYNNIDIYDSRGDAVLIAGRDGKSINNIELNGVNIYGLRGISYSNPGHKKYYAFNFENAHGNGTFNNCSVTDVQSDLVTNFNNSGNTLSSGNWNGFNLTTNPPVTSRPSVTVPEGMNLAVTAIDWYPSNNLSEGQYVNFTITVTNDSETYVPEDIPVIVTAYIDGVQIFRQEILSGWNPYESKTLNTGWTAKGGLHIFKATVDPNNAIYDGVDQTRKSREKKIGVRSDGVAWTFTRLPDYNNKKIQVLDLSWKKEGEESFGHSALTENDKVVWKSIIFNGTDNDYNTKIGVLYQVNGKAWPDSQLSWTDQTNSLKARETKEFIAQGGPIQPTDIIIGLNGFSYLKVTTDTHNNVFEDRVFQFELPYAGEGYDGSYSDEPDNNNSTGIWDVNSTTADDAWYSIDGCRLKSAPTRPGLYIRAGKKHLQ